MSGRVTGTMSDADALLWTIGRDPFLRPTVVAVMALDRAPRFGDLQARHLALTGVVPRLRSRVVERPLGLGSPRFIEDGSFNLDLHLRRIVIPPPATFRSVLDLAQVMATTGFDPQLPLWEAAVVEGLEDGRAAYVVKLHHALVDGVGGIAVLLHLLDRHRRPARGGSGPRGPSALSGAARHVPEEPSDADGRARGPTWRFADLATRAGSDVSPDPSAPRRLLDFLDDMARTALHPSRPVELGVSTIGSAARLLAPARRPVSPLMVGRSMSRRFEVLDPPWRELKQAATATGGTVNDVFVAGIVTGLRRYHEIHGVSIDSLRVLMPVSVRSGSDAITGNRFVPARFVVAASPDPRECVRQVQRVAGAWKQAPGLAISDALAAGLNLLPSPLVSALWGSMLKGDDFCVTNVPGPPFETYLSGSCVERVYAFAPPSGAALNVSLVTPASRACVGVNVDTQAVPDSAKLAACLDEGIEEVLVLGRGPRQEA
ncbi:MAG TPA: wax ester/triacylglycerol synthase domain-containing protein [Acidimicrobiales bacterium]|nr:wax ester/triacylglycerol synthase domain-containing protein [Acidimicrobiales bacterium]